MFNTLRTAISSASRPVNVADSHLCMRLDDSQLEPPQAGGPICHAPGERTPVVKIHHEPDVWFLKCFHCHACSASRMPKSSFLQQYYQHYFEHPEVKVSFQDYERFYHHVVKLGAVNNATGNEYRILDFGGGDGRLSLYIAQRMISAKRITKAHITLLDFNAPAPSLLPEIAISSVTDLEQVATGSQDLLLASGVFEHVPAIGNMLVPLFARLKIGACFYARVPYAVPMKQLFKDYDLQFPMHVHDMGPPFWRYLCTNLVPNLSLEVSQPSIVKTTLSKQPLATIAATLLKLPAHIQMRLPVINNCPLLCRWVGGWEVVIKRR